jgi:hypothetical protein
VEFRILGPLEVVDDDGQNVALQAADDRDRRPEATPSLRE